MSKNSAPTSSPSTSKAVDVIDLTQDDESKVVAPPPTLKRKNEESTNEDEIRRFQSRRSGLSKKVDWDYGSENPFHMKKYEIVDGVEVVQTDPYTVIEFFVKKMDLEKKVRLAEDEHAEKNA
ncbi:hypothetical protein [Parasitella parasitica]|uniref:Uncharacterized protein n=1 Tax=Parasitella parasitica TaxID=35722 RepID=A0A0B7MZ07_9FUNG|nr:hypothetical protein [Parasitella parasitica]